MLEENNEKEVQKKKIEIVKGSPKDLNISEVRDNLTFERSNEEKKENIIIPETLDSDNKD